MKTRFSETYLSPGQIVQNLKERGMLMDNERKAEKYLMNIGYLYRLCMIRYFLGSVSPNNNFNEKLVDLLARFPSVDVTAMEFCENWRHEPLWQ